MLTNIINPIQNSACSIWSFRSCQLLKITPRLHFKMHRLSRIFSQQHSGIKYVKCNFLTSFLKENVCKM